LKTMTAKIYKFAKIVKNGYQWLVVIRKLNAAGEWFWGFDSMHYNEADAKIAFRQLVLSPQSS